MQWLHLDCLHCYNTAPIELYMLETVVSQEACPVTSNDNKYELLLFTILYSHVERTHDLHSLICVGLQD